MNRFEKTVEAVTYRLEDLKSGLVKVSELCTALFVDLC